MSITPDSSAVVEVAGVSKNFGVTRALDDVSFTLRPASTHALIGENGAGKSTLIKVITGVYRPDRGELRMDGRPVHFARPSDAQQAGISTIYQEVNLIPLQSVARNIFMGREPRDRFGLIDFKAMDRQARALLSEYGIQVDVRRQLRSLGLGLQQMVALARAVSVDAKVVIMDEPTSSLEPREVETLFGVVRRLHDKGVGIIYVSHRLDELYAVCDQVTVMRDGRVVHSGELAALPRLELVAMMLGRKASEVATAGRTELESRPPVALDIEPALEVRGLTSSPLLKDVSFQVRPGEVVGLGGLLGAGRSETAKAVAGAFPINGGTVLVRGKQVRKGSTAAAIRSGIALLSEDRRVEGLIPSLSVRENIVLAALPRLSRFGIVSRARQDRLVRTFVDRLRIKIASPEQRVSELSGGNQQKVLLARWLCTEPTILLLDEPTRGIDVGAKAEVQSLITDLAEQGLAVVLISSELEELLEGSDRVVVLRDGAVAGELIGDDVNEHQLMATLALSAEEAGDVRTDHPDR